MVCFIKGHFENFRRMNSIKTALLILPLMFFCQKTIPSNDSLVNGNFEQELNIGWNQFIDYQNTLDVIDRATNLDSDTDYEARIKKYDASCAKLYQTVNITSTNMQFSVKVNLSANEINHYATYWSAAAICLRYLSSNNNLLGETRIVYKSAHCPWVSSNTVHLIEATVPDTWQTYSFNLNTELTNLSGVNPANIKMIQVVVMDTTNGC